MFVQDNTVESIRGYLEEHLVPLYGEREATNMIHLLFNHFLGLSRFEIGLNRGALLSESQLLDFHFALKRLKKSEPLQYILGETWFHGLKFKVNSSVLVPRPETEELVELILSEDISNQSVIDVGTGSGCIPVSIKKTCPNTEVFGLDVSEKALVVADENARINKVEITWINSDIIQQPVLDRTFDVVISNPPYITVKEKAQMEPNVLNHEPELALFVPNEEPLKFYEAIADWSQVHLNKGGRLYFEINQAYGKEVVQCLRTRNFTDIRLIKDLNSKDRIVAARFL